MIEGITFQLGPLVVRISGDSPVTPWAEHTYAGLRCVGEPDLSFEFTGDELGPSGEERVGDKQFEVARGAVRFRLRQHDVLLRREAASPGPSRWRVQLRRRDSRPRLLRVLSDPEEAWKMWLSHGASLDTHLLKEFAYTISPLVIQCALLERGAALIHAGGLALGGRGVLLPAWGGAGKSTVVSRCVLHGRASFLADDHAVIDSSGQMHLHLLPIHAYAYHARQDPLLKQRMLDACTPANRLAWRFAAAIRPKRAVRWVSPAEMYTPGKLARRAAIEQVIVMFRGDSESFVWEDISHADAARPCVGVIAEEINGFAERLALANAGWAEPILPSPGEGYDRIRRLYEQAFAGAACARMIVPRGANGDALMKFLRGKCPLIAESATPPDPLA